MLNPIRHNPWTRLLDNLIDTAAIIGSAYFLWGTHIAASLTFFLACLSFLGSAMYDSQHAPPKA